MRYAVIARSGVVILAAWLGPWGAAEAQQFQVGIGRQIITPDPLLPVSGGLGPTSPVTQKRGELTARAVVFQRGQERVAIVGLDLLGFPSVLCARVSAEVPRIPADILISSTHTHSAPDCYAFPDGSGGHTGDLSYIASVCRKTAAAINQAVDNLQPASIRIASDDAQGRIAYNYYAPDLYDRRMSVLQALDRTGQPLVTLVNFGVHPEVLGSQAGILSPDLVGPFAERVESQGGGMALFVNSAIGGMVTADNRLLDEPSDAVRGYWKDERTWEACQRIGTTMADEALRIAALGRVQQDPALRCAALTVQLPVDSDLLWQVLQNSPLGYPGQDERTVATRLNLVNLGTAQILTIPGEALPNIGFYLRRKMRGEHNFLFGLTNDAMGYILMPVDFQSFPRYAYISRTSLGERTGEILLTHWLDLIDRSPRPTPPTR